MEKQQDQRLVLYLTSFPKLSETFIVNKFLGLLRAGWDVHIVCTKSLAEDWKYFPELEKHPQARSRVHTAWPHRPRWLAVLLIPVVVIYCFLQASQTTLRYLSRGWKRFGMNILRQLYLDAGIISSQPDVLHFEFGALAPERMYLADLLGCKIIVSFRGYDINYAGLDKTDYYQAVWHQADMLHFLGNDLWQRALHRGCSADKPHVFIPPAINAEHFVPAECVSPATVHDQAYPLRIVSVGRLEWKKGPEFALQAIHLLIRRGIACQYWMVGDGEMFEAVAFARHQLGLEESVKLLGSQTSAQVKEALQWADVFLHAAVSEGFCNAVLEAQAMRLPVVTSNAGGLGENVQDGITGFVVPRRDPAALAEKLALLAGDSSLRQRMGRAGRKRVIENFQIAHQINKFESTYNHLIDA